MNIKCFKKLFFGLVVGFGVMIVKPSLAQSDLCIVRPVIGSENITELITRVPRTATNYRVRVPQRFFRASIATFRVASSSGTARVLRNRDGTLTITGRILPNSGEEVIRISNIVAAYLVGIPEKLAVDQIPQGVVGDRELLEILFRFDQKTPCTDPEQPYVLDYNANQLIDNGDLEIFFLNYFGREIAHTKNLGDIIIRVVRRNPTTR